MNNLNTTGAEGEARFSRRRMLGYMLAEGVVLGMPELCLALVRNDGALHTNSLGMEFILCPAGTFMMGGNRDGPVHQVTLTRPFYLGRFPVTQAQWEAVMGNNPSCFTGAEHPVERVSWHDAQAFITTLNRQEGTNSYRLPTEAEWEYGASAGTTEAWFWDEDEDEEELGEYAWFRGNSDDSTHPVGLKKANPWGLHDMCGNVWEWVEDRYKRYTAASSVDPRGPASGDYRVLRGGSWLNYAEYCRSASRNNRTPDNRNCHVGFRLALSPG